MSIISTTTVTLDCGPLGELEFEVEYEYSYTAGKVSGPPEDCYPPDEALDILTIKTTLCGVTIDVTHKLDDNDALLDEIGETAHEEWRDRKARCRNYYHEEE